jgi:hypothetical protein
MPPTARYSALLRRLRAGARVVIDGATGTEVERRGVPLLENAWNAQAQVSHPQVLQSVHEDYYRAGAEIVISNTFACSRHVLTDAGERERFEEYNRKAVELACTARGSAGGEGACVAGGIANWSFAGREISLEELTADTEAQAIIMRDAGADLIMLEMMVDMKQMLATLAGAQQAGLPVWVGLTCGGAAASEAAPASDLHRSSQDGGGGGGGGGGTSESDDEPALSSGEPLKDALLCLADKDVDVVNIMHTEVELIDACLGVVREHWPGIHGAKNAFFVRFVYQNRSFCQDRLGTNEGKPKRAGIFRRCLRSQLDLGQEGRYVLYIVTSSDRYNRCFALVC